MNPGSFFKLSFCTFTCLSTNSLISSWICVVTGGDLYFAKVQIPTSARDLVTMVTSACFPNYVKLQTVYQDITKIYGN